MLRSASLQQRQQVRSSAAAMKIDVERVKSLCVCVCLKKAFLCAVRCLRICHKNGFTIKLD